MDAEMKVMRAVAHANEIADRQCDAARTRAWRKAHKAIGDLPDLAARERVRAWALAKWPSAPDWAITEQAPIWTEADERASTAGREAAQKAAAAAEAS